MRALLFTVLVSFNLVACVTGDNEAGDEMPPGVISAAEANGVADLDDVAGEDAQLRPSREVPATPGTIETQQTHKQPKATGPELQPANQLPELVTDDELEQLDNDPLEQIDQDELHGKQIDEDLPVLR